MRKRWLYIIAVLVAFAAPAAAQEAEPEWLRVTATNTTAEADGRESAGGVVLPGDVLEYRLTLTNRGGEAVQDVVFTDPIPSGLEFVLGSAGAERADVRVDYSIDRGATWSPNPTIRVETADGVVERPAAPADYTHIRWTLSDPLAPGAAVTARFRASAIGAAGAGR